jgi:hypothetical protein
MGVLLSMSTNILEENAATLQVQSESEDVPMLYR